MKTHKFRLCPPRHTSGINLIQLVFQSIFCHKLFNIQITFYNRYVYDIYRHLSMYDESVMYLSHGAHVINKETNKASLPLFSFPIYLLNKWTVQHQSNKLQNLNTIFKPKQQPVNVSLISRISRKRHIIATARAYCYSATRGLSQQRIARVQPPLCQDVTTLWEPQCKKFLVQKFYSLCYVFLERDIWIGESLSLDIFDLDNTYLLFAIVKSLIHVFNEVVDRTLNS